LRIATFTNYGDPDQITAGRAGREVCNAGAGRVR